MRVHVAAVGQLRVGNHKLLDFNRNHSCMRNACLDRMNCGVTNVGPAQQPLSREMTGKPVVIGSALELCNAFFGIEPVICSDATEPARMKQKLPV